MSDGEQDFIDDVVEIGIFLKKSIFWSELR